MIRVGIRGAKGRMGQEAVAAIAGESDLEVVAAADMGDDCEKAFGEANVEVAVDFTNPAALADGIPAALRAGASVVVGTSGVTDAMIGDWRKICGELGRSVLVVPNFCVGVVLLQRFAEEAARYFPEVEILEMHHEKKIDSPSGTASDTARRVASARGDAENANSDDSAFRGGRIGGVPVHSVRLPGLLAHQVVWFGGLGEVLSIRHDSLDRGAFMPGVLRAVRGVRDLDGVQIGLEHCLGPSRS